MAPTTPTVTKEQAEFYVRMFKEHGLPLVGEIVDERLSKLREAAGKGRTAVADLLGSAETPPPPKRDTQKGFQVARMLIAYAAAVGQKGGLSLAAEIAKKSFGPESIEAKALAAQDAAGGGFLIRDELAAEIIEFLRPMSAVRQLNPVMSPMDAGTNRLPRITGGASATYIAENQNLVATQPTFGVVQPVAKKLGGLVPISNDLIRRVSVSIQQTVRDDLVAGIAQKGDAAFIRSVGAGGEPKGLRYWPVAANIITANATVNTANTIKDLGKMIEALANANVRFIRPGWLFSHRTWRFLFTLLDANSNHVFRDEMKNGTLYGYPFARTSQIPNNLGGGSNESEVYLADFADVVVAEATQILVDVSTEAAYFDGAATASAFSLDQTVIRAIVEHDLVMRHDESVAVLVAAIWT
jgi:HK97 family phage major capsid protein